MPTMAQKLTKQSSPGAISAAISDSISQLVKEGYPQDQAIRVAHEQAAKATGKELGRKRD